MRAGLLPHLVLLLYACPVLAQPAPPGQVKVEITEEEEVKPPGIAPAAKKGEQKAEKKKQKTEHKKQAPKNEEATPPATAPVEDAPPAGTVEEVKEVKEGEEPEEQVVTSATRTSQTVTEAPAIISVVTREQILALGYRSLTEVLRDTVGFDVNDNLHWPDTGVRGINSRTSYGNKILMLIDGHNMGWRQFNRNYHHPGWVAMEDISRIELIRGPGSATWGANALNGVVNIITRDWAALDGAEFTAGMDHRFDHQFMSARAGTTLGEHFKVGASIAYYADDADALLAPIHELTQLQKVDVPVQGDREQGITLGLRARYRWFSLSFQKIRHETGAPLSTFSVIGGDDSRFLTDRHIVRVNFSAMAFKSLELSAEMAYDDYRFIDGTVYERYPKGPGRNSLAREVVGMEAADRRWELKVRANYVPSLRVQVNGGVELEFLDLDRWHFPEQWRAAGLDKDLARFQNVHFGAYLQAQYSPIDILAITAGLRLDYDQVYGLVLMYDYVPPPRLGVVLRLPAGVYLKGLVGMAYRAPSFHDMYYFRKDAYYGNPEVKPEQAVTAELQIGYRPRGRLDLRVTGFYSRIDDLIGYAAIAADTSSSTPPLISEAAFPASQRPSGAYNQVVNQAHVSTAGAELEASIRVHRRVTLNLNGTVRYPWSADGERLSYSALWTVSGGLLVRANRHLQINLRARGVGGKKVPARGLAQPGWGCPVDAATGLEQCWTASTDPTLEAPAYAVGTAVIRAQDILYDGISLHLKLDNFTNTNWYDAGRDVLYPQRRFQGMLWLTLKL